MLLMENPATSLCSTRIEKAVRTQLNSTGYPLLSAITYRFHDGLLVLNGEVPSFYLKQVAQEVVRRVNGVETVENEIEVNS